MDRVVRRRRWLLLAVISIAVFSMASQSCVINVQAYEDRDFGPVTTEQRDLSGFTGIDAGGIFDIEVTKATEYSVEIDAGEELHAYIDTRVSNKTLKIKFNRSLRNVDDVVVRISMPELNHVDISGASSAQVGEGFVAEEFSLVMSGAADSQINIAANKLTADLSGAAELDLWGKAVEFELDASGASEIDATGLTATDANVDLSGASEASINVLDKLEVDVSGASALDCVTKPQITHYDSSGVSDVDC